MEPIHFLNGKLVSEKELLMSPRDLGYSRGYGVFDFLITYHHRPFLLQKHIDRLFRSAEAIALSVPWTKEQVSEWVMKTLDANKTITDEKVIRITISGGSSFTLTPSSSPTMVMTIDSAISCPAEDYENGVAVISVEFQRYRPEAKTNNYIEAVRGLNGVSSQNIDELIYHSNGMVREGSRSNIFTVTDGRLLTPKTNILEGITRGVILDLVKLPIPIVVEDFSIDALRTASEVFITSTGKDVMPVTKIDGALVGNGKVGPVTSEVMKQFRSFVDSDRWYNDSQY